MPEGDRDGALDGVLDPLREPLGVGFLVTRSSSDCRLPLEPQQPSLTLSESIANDCYQEKGGGADSNAQEIVDQYS